MDYLDPKKQLRHRTVLLVGYVLIGVAIGLSTLVLVMLAYGFNLDKNRTVIQQGLIFFSSQPDPANIYINGTLKNAKTDTRLALPGGIYDVQLKRDGYRTWQRRIELEGGRVANFDYPLLFPQTLKPQKLQTYTAAPRLMTQSPDKRWLLIEQPGTQGNFDVYDLKSPAKPPAALSLAANLTANATSHETWQLGEWASDNRHLVLRHDYDDKTEFIMIDREQPGQSLNLNASLTLPETGVALRLIDKKYDRYYLHDAAATLQTVSLKAPVAELLLERVLSFQTYSDDMVLYVTDDQAPAEKVQVKLRQGNATANIRTLPAGSPYLLTLAEHNRKLFVAAGAAAENKLYVYRDPLGQLAARPGHALVPTHLLRVTAPNYLQFSDTGQFVMAENGTEFGVYDVRNAAGYQYTGSLPLDAPQNQASWMDGHRLVYSSGGKLTVFDYDQANRQVLVPADSRFTAAFSPDYKYVYTLAPSVTAGQLDLLRTPLQTDLE